MEKKLLIVDDEVGVCENLKGFFSLRGYTVDTAGGGQEALDKMKTTFFPVILSDVRMPGVDGKKVLEEALKLHPETKVIMITGFNDEEAEKWCREHGAFDYLTKPVNLRDLITIVNNICNT